MEGDDFLVFGGVFLMVVVYMYGGVEEVVEVELIFVWFGFFLIVVGGYVVLECVVLGVGIFVVWVYVYWVVVFVGG